MAARIGKDDFTEQVLNSTLPVLVDFYSDSCIACKMLSPAFAAAEEELPEKVRFYKVNTAFEEKLAEEYGILSQPTLILFNDGVEQARTREVLKADALLAWLNSYLE